LTLAERDRLVARLGMARKATLPVLGRLIGLTPGEGLALPGQGMAAVPGDEVGAAFSHKRCLGLRWGALDIAAQWAIIEQVANEPDPEALASWLMANHGITADAAEAVAQISLPHGYDRLGLAATRLVVDELRCAVVTGREAQRRALGGLPTGVNRSGGYARLPYYGQVLTREIPPGTLIAGDADERRWGKVAHPSLHLAFNQLRRLMNGLIEVQGRPDEVVIAIARNLRLSERDKSEAAGRKRGYTRAAIVRSEHLLETDRPDSGRNRALLKLWEELAVEDPEARACPFCGTLIAEQHLFGTDIAITHILPFSRSFDDSWANRTVAHRSCIAEKGARTPWEAWGNSARWPLLVKSVEQLDRTRQWRFGPAAMARIDGAGGAIASQLSDWHRVSALARRYLASLYDDGAAVWGTPGRLTRLLRRRWDLDSILPDHDHGKVAGQTQIGRCARTDLRHSAIDAMVAGLMAPRFLDLVAESMAFAEDEGKGGVFDNLPEPWEGFRADLKGRLGKVWVSHKADHGRAGPVQRAGTMGGTPAGVTVRTTGWATGGRLHNETAYGLTGHVNERGAPVVVHTIAFSTLKPADVFAGDRIAGEDLRRALAQALAGCEGKAFEQGLAEFAQSHPVFRGIRRVRVRQALTVIPVRDEQGHIYKGFKGDANAIYEIWELPEGKWVAQVTSMHEAHQPPRYLPGQVAPRPHPAARRVLTLHQNDMIALCPDDGPGSKERQLMRVLSIGSNGQIRLAAHCEGGVLRERDALPNEVDPFKYLGLTPGGLKRVGARKVHVDVLGRVRDSGPH
jgi:CRISPR-associated endonuclease Csn1